MKAQTHKQAYLARPFSKLSLFVTLLCTALYSQAAILVQYNMTDGPTRATPTTIGTDVFSASDLTGTNMNANTLVPFLSADYSGWSRSAGFAGTTVSEALSDSTYFAFTLTPDAGKRLSFSDMNFKALAATAGPSSRQLYIFSSINPYTAGNELFSRSTEASTISTTPLIPYNTATSEQSFSVDLSSIGTLAVDEEITFRFYIQTPTINQQIAFDDITVNGAVIPEPSSLVLLGLAALSMIVLHRRKAR